MNEVTTYQVTVVYPGGERRPEVYNFEDKLSLEEGMGTLALIHLNLRDGLRRTFEITPIKEVQDVPTADPPDRTDESGE